MSIKILITFSIIENRVPMCTEDQLCKRRKRSLGKERHQQQCTPGSQWKNDCNDCFCTETGIAACTLRGCFPERRPQIIELVRPNFPVLPINDSGARYRQTNNNYANKTSPSLSKT